MPNRITRSTKRAATLVVAQTLVSLGLLIALTVPGPGVASGAPPIGRATRVFSLNESGDLHLTSKHGFTLNEQGQATGSVKGAIYVHLKIVSTTRVTAEINIYPKGGSISGHGTAGYRRGSSTASFSGSLSIDQGSGTYSHARGSGLSFSGTIQRSNDAITVRVSGRASD